ncbi:hypothetical protein L0669_02195 [Flavobacterium bizetiae]|uniref:hypothetical protein n=1 Tax=Flavobacterium bizetiae TaxID=2704140 RepID=UPI0021E7F796|nr:hypothetical protein [Flavobacterium bizetiae]UTN04725.1 hypothetical protein L0669_02195 [Flavobacterium bizetiae]
MKTINNLNYFFVGFPFILIALGFSNNQAFGELAGYGLFFSILTGLFQVTIGGCMLFDEPKNKYLQLYILGVVFYFVMICINPFSSHDFKTYFVIGIPTILAFYLSLLIYKKAYQ